MIPVQKQERVSESQFSNMRLFLAAGAWLPWTVQELLPLWMSLELPWPWHLLPQPLPAAASKYGRGQGLPAPPGPAEQLLAELPARHRGWARATTRTETQVGFFQNAELA